MLNVALTGNIAAGKSTVAALFQRWGATVIDADTLVREVQAPGSPVLQRIVERFGPEVLRPDGTLDRGAVRARVATDPGLRRALEAIVHPAVRERRAALVAQAGRRGDRIVVSDIPLLFETQDPGAFDAVVLVDAPEPLRRERLVQRSGLAPAEVEGLLGAQLPPEAKRAWRGGTPARPALVIENTGDRETLERNARAVWDRLEQLAGGGSASL